MKEKMHLQLKIFTYKYQIIFEEKTYTVIIEEVWNDIDCHTITNVNIYSHSDWEIVDTYTCDRCGYEVKITHDKKLDKDGEIYDKIIKEFYERYG